MSSQIAATDNCRDIAQTMRKKRRKQLVHDHVHAHERTNKLTMNGGPDWTVMLRMPIGGYAGTTPY